ncbi:MAG: DUF1206 domain-containing protein [Microbacterium sp.]
MSAPAAKAAARGVESSTIFELFARAGYVANGIVHLLLGVIVLVIAFGGDGEGDQAGAYKALAAAPLGVVLLWLMAIALCALGLWHAAEGILARDLSGDVKGAARKWGRRAAEWGQAVVFVGLGVLAGVVALGARPDGEEAAEAASRGVLDLWGGPIVLALVGVGFTIGGVSFVVMGALRSFRSRLNIPDGRIGRTMTIMGVVGFVAKGIALLIVGILLIIAAVRTEPRTAGGLDGAVQAILDLTLGPLLAGIVGVGFLAYGVFTVFRARVARMQG